MKIIASIAVLGLLATPVLAAETGVKADAKAGSNTTMKGDMPGMTMKGDHDKMGGSMQGSMSGTMMMSGGDHAKMMSDKQKKAKAQAMTDSSASSSASGAPGNTMMMSGKDKH